MKKFVFALSLLPLFLQLTSCSDDDDSTPGTDPETPVTVLPDNITFESLSLYPEDFAYDSANERFFAGSAYTGDIVSIDLEGNVTTLTESEDLISTIGILFDEANNHVVVCNSAPPFADQGTVDGVTNVLATIVRYDATTGEEVSTHDLSTLFDGPHVINDIVLDDNGNLYATDSFSPAIYRVATDGTASLFATDPLFATPEAFNFGLNGIEFHPDGFLLVVNRTNQTLLTVSIADPTNVTEVAIEAELGSGDGIRLLDNDNLLFVSNSLSGGEQSLFTINSADEWATASIANTTSLGSGGNFPTTIEFADSTPYVISSYIVELATGASTTTATFEINKIDL